MLRILFLRMRVNLIGFGDKSKTRMITLIGDAKAR